MINFLVYNSGRFIRFVKNNDKGGSIMLDLLVNLPFKNITFFLHTFHHFLWGFDAHYIVNLSLIISVAQCLA